MNHAAKYPSCGMQKSSALPLTLSKDICSEALLLSPLVVNVRFALSMAITRWVMLSVPERKVTGSPTCTSSGVISRTKIRLPTGKVCCMDALTTM